jgi:glucose-1-phosphate thymidylyltransferase
MRVIIPVAGVGSRLRPHTYTIPKVLLNVAGKPIIGHLLDRLIENGFNEVTVVVGYLGDKIKEYINAHYSIKVDFVEQEERLGLGHAIYLSKHTFSREPILIVLGDTIFDLDYKAFTNGEYSAIGVHQVDDPRRFGVVETTGDLISRLVEKPENPSTNLAVVGLYYIKRPELLVESLKEMIKKNVRTKNEYQLTDALQMMLERGEKMRAFPIDGWYDCGRPETLLATNKLMLDRTPGTPSLNGVVIHAPSFVSPKAIVKNSVIGPYTTIAAGARVENAIVKNSIINEEAVVSDALLVDSIVGNNALVRGSYKKINIGDSSELEFN